MPKSRSKAGSWVLWLLLPLGVGLAAFVGREMGSTAARDVAQSDREASTEELPTIVKVVRQSAEGATSEQIDDEFVRQLGLFLAASINESSETTYEHRGTILYDEDRAFAEVQLIDSDKTMMVQLVRIEDGELVRITCASGTEEAISVSDPDCAAKIREVFKVDPAALSPMKPEGDSEMPFEALQVDQPSAFTDHRFDGEIRVSIPSSWAELDDKLANDINTASEAIASQANAGGGQGNNEVLIAANAFDGVGATVATVRLSVRSWAELNQAEMRQGARENPDDLRPMMLMLSENTAKSLRALPNAKYYTVRDVGLAENDSLFCMWSSFAYDIGKGPTVSDSWVCPMGDRTIKLTTSYIEGLSSVYSPIMAHIWKSLEAN